MKKKRGTAEATPDAESTPEGKSDRPHGIKKAKTVASAQKMIESTQKTISTHLDDMKENQSKQDEKKFDFMTNVMKQLQESSRNNMAKLESVVSNSTTKLTDTMNMKLLLDTDLTRLNPAFQAKAKRAIESYFESNVFSNIDSEE